MLQEAWLSRCEIHPVLFIRGISNSAGQIAKKLIGCKTVIGIAGGDAKCQWVKSLGADICLNYKSPTFKQDLIDATQVR